MALIPGVENINWVAIFLKVAYWIGYLLIIAFIMGVFVFIYYVWKFKYKLTVWPLYGSGQDGIFAFDKPKKNRVCWNKEKTAWKKLWPFMNREELEPFDSEYIYPGNNILAFDLNGQLIPARINITQTEETIRAEVNPVPYYIRNWQSLQHKKNNVEFAEKDWWQDNKAMVCGVITVGLCLVACMVTIYLNLKFAGPGIVETGRLADAINSFGNIPAK